MQLAKKLLGMTLTVSVVEAVAAVAVVASGATGPNDVLFTQHEDLALTSSFLPPLKSTSFY